MADYKELIRKAIQALPENNGAARRAVYEKARAALVGQLRGLNPPLPARDITQHRLQLEDCIRQVEQEASEAVIAGLKQNEDLAPRPQPALAAPRAVPTAPRPVASPPRPAPTSGARPSAAAPTPRSPAASVPSPRPAVVAPAATHSSVMKPTAPAPAPRVAAVQPQSTAAVATLAPATRPASALRPIARPQVGPQALAQPEPEPESEADLAPETIEDIIAAAEGGSRANGAPPVEDPIAETDEPEAPPPSMFKLEARPAPRVEPVAAPRVEGRPVPAIVARAEATKAGRSAKALEAPRRAGGGEASGPVSPQPDREPAARAPQGVEPIHLPRASNSNAAMSRVSEVDLEAGNEGDPQIAIERAIATLEREARNDEGEVETEENDFPVARPTGPGRRRARREPATVADVGFARAPVERERGGGSAITIFLLVFLVLLIVAGGAAIWAWREGFIDFDAMFGKTAPTASQTSSITPPPSPQPTAAESTAATAAAAQTNTEPAPSTPAQSSAPLSAGPGPAPAGPVPLAPMASAPAEPSAQTGTPPKSEERLSSQSDDTTPAPAMADASKPSADGTPAAAAGSQSLLLEASQDGTTGAVPFSGTVEWSEGKDEMGQPTLVGKANIPARNLGVSVLIRKNSDPTLPASHLMEINFSVNDSFIGGSIAGLPGVLMKNEELVQGTPLVGASARVVGNSFLFALSSSPADEATNRDLLTSRKWIDLAIIYATGKKAIITLEKDDKAEQLFTQVFDEWSKEAAATPAAAPPPKAN